LPESYADNLAFSCPHLIIALEQTRLFKNNMILSEASVPTFPLVSLQMVTNARHEWVGVAFNFEKTETDDIKAFMRLYDEIGLRDALGDFLCLLDAPDLNQVDIEMIENLPRKQLV
jgi:hypothetical protein